ncbi:protein phosphatase 2C-like domain-containing protein 1 [Oncorhynchus mykiss]|uniref:protein phosphatase 2C-like domain-containing protein 1 n=1 Tax=Oncorhynchus mykiss TaxID=8022 RepID=UPI001877C379|nr:protein phosphatase 2C-like domain-containing protein 1 [Oncorhynchus mykiss]
MLVLVLEQLSKQDPLLSLEKDQVKLLSRFEALFQEYYNRPYPGQAQNIALGLGTKQLENLTKVEQVNLAFTTAFWKMDRLLGLGKDETSKIRWSGCTALFCLIDSGLPSSDEKEQGTGQESNIPKPSQELQGGRILIADCGKVHSERKHILWSGETISINKQHGLVEWLTKATRVLSHYGDRKLKSVIPVPYSVSLPTDPSYQLLVLASSDLWEVLDDHASCSRSEVNVKETMADSLKNLTLNYECLAADICRELMDTVLVSGSKENISVMTEMSSSRQQVQGGMLDLIVLT